AGQIGTNTFALPTPATYTVGSILVRQQNTFGNSHDGSNSQTIVFDNSANAPGISITDSGSSNSDHITSSTTVTITGLESGAIASYRLKNGSWTDLGSGVSTFNLTEGSWGIGEIEVRQRDTAGNLSASTPNGVAWTVDLTAPVVPTVTMPADNGSNNSDGITGLNTVTISGLEGGATWSYNLKNAGWVTGTGTTLTLSPDGTYAIGDIQVRQTDLAGHQTTGQNTVARTVDTIGNPLTLSLTSDTGSSSSDGVTKNASITVSGLETNATWEYSLDSGGQWSTGTGNSFSMKSETSYAANVIRVRQTDVVGNVGTGNNTSTYTYDATVPALPTLALAQDTGSFNNDFITKTGTVNVTLPGDAATWEYTLNGSTWTAGTGTTFAVKSDGSYTTSQLMVRASDLAGNVSATANLGATLVYDTTA
ncbi:MAG: hypothetical protein Q7U84_06070, partial [Polynucleobacter sp.]|nr:hypothetical protein [Polynucleobacter sp.]